MIKPYREREPGKAPINLNELQEKLNHLFSRLPEFFKSLLRGENLEENLPIIEALNLPPELLAELVKRFQGKIEELKEKIRKIFDPTFIFDERGEAKIKYIIIIPFLLATGVCSFLINLMQDLTSTLESDINTLSWLIMFVAIISVPIHAIFFNEWTNRIIQTGRIPDLSQIMGSDIERNRLMRERDRFLTHLVSAFLIIIFLGPWGLGTHLLTHTLHHISGFLGQLSSPVSSLEAQFQRIIWLLIGEFSELVDLLSKLLSNLPPQS